MNKIAIQETTLSNARIVLADQVLEGAVCFADGVITDIGEASGRGQDLNGDYLIPGLVELHTDHLETHYAPRPKVRWHPVAAVQAHDAQIAASGITTVFDAIRVGLDEHSDMGTDELRILADAITAGVNAGRLRADHLIHLRCEVSAPDCLKSFEKIMDHPLVRLASLMDHAPGQRQFASADAYRVYYQGKLKMSDQALAEFIARRSHESSVYSDKHRKALAELSNSRGIALASHDDATSAHVDAAKALGIRIAEFPTTLEAAQASREAGMAILMGGPNVVRGGSHSGNVSARELAAAGLLDILSSDYIPFSMLQSAFCLVETVPGISLPEAISFVTKRPAEAAGLKDRGEIAIGKRADLVHLRIEEGIPIVQTVWRQGIRVI
ncbi:MAG: alpha-D-ribose 1-methylphosphonate 5-triphosphate diphosphatase [Devosia sp.]|jgi:alpha-D-ribose 1-methylphosphonate 5-triphosphate diphosphatase|uniref:alpha-D-ribose 1-methylphosphonate 5-triphosphate diphosphatase n=1 Tax=unclassified Devosia TaxID=196773 RepID=UPI0019E95FBF|nr:MULTISPECIES: alpha-D-ribose 1-methylphosphonate 5-triphosphate diphosphatase [unclassified Devosia]MBF0678679.1 alpha-D-ribose 1-methylphosphonate 5-triphosphate diphosphatase [Devosia sp.]WEJ31750.1 alpha-D-ribose 1-methylphosphonate 5-triphosphate diphosphatase [Devosia sp. SD17-2]